MAVPVESRSLNGRHRGWVHSHSATLVDLYRIVDAAWILGGLRYAYWHLNVPWSDAYLSLALPGVALFMLFSGLWPLYRSWRIAPLRTELLRAAACWFVSIAFVSLISYVVDPLPGTPRSVIPIWGMATFVGLLGARAVVRICLRMLRRGGRNFRTAAIVGATESGERIERVITHTSWMGLRMAGFYEDRRTAAGRRSSNVTVAGNFGDLLERIRADAIDIVYIALPLRAEVRIARMIRKLRDSTVSVHYVPDFTPFGLLHPSWENLAGTPVIGLIDTPHRGIDGFSKRMFDVIVGGIALIVLAVPMLLIAIAIKLTSSGPIIFRQKRYGMGGKAFVMWKFRTMTVCEDGSTTFTQATPGDARVTRLGAFLRRTSLDELPQFFNVVQGRMSIVGPRPHPVALNETHRKLIEGYMLRHKVRPGVTGWAQINGFRGETDQPEKMLSRIQYDLEYIDNWSLAWDLKIIAGTVTKMVADQNAY